MMKQWITGLLFVGFTLAGLAGCSHQCFVDRIDYNQAVNGLPHDLEQSNPGENLPPLTGISQTPPTVDYPERPPRHMTLQEAIALSLENGTVSGPGGTGVVNDNFVTLQSGLGAPFNGQSDKIRVLSYNPANQQAAVEASLARFDATWVTSMNWSTTDNLQQGLSSFSNGQSAQFSSSLVKAFASGAVANVSFLTSYQQLQNPPVGVFGVLNPNYTARLTIGIEQPLLQSFGVEMNQLLNHVPPVLGLASPDAGIINNRYNSLTQIPAFSGTTVEGILVARLRLDGQRAEFERNLNNLLLNAEVAYWNLYRAYGSLYSNEEVLRISHKAWMIYKTRYDAGKIGPDEYEPIHGQYEQFRGARLQSLRDVLEAERNLRGIIGLPVDDGTRIVPITPPSVAPYEPDWQAALQDALNLKPELILARDNLRASQYNLIVSKNFLRPDLRAFAKYSPVGFGSTLDGVDTFIDGTGTQRTANAFRSLASDHFNDWSVGLTMNINLGYRVEQAAVRQSRLTLQQAFLLVKDQEDRAERVLDQNFVQVGHWYRQIEARKAEREAQAKGLEARFRKFAAGQISADALLDQQNRLSAAQLREYEAIAEYNNSLARFEWARGTIRQNDNVTIAEGPLPQCAQVRAVDHERERSKAIVLRQPPLPYAHPGRLVGDCTGEPNSVHIDGDAAPAPIAPASGVDLPKGNPPAGALPPGKLPTGNLPGITPPAGPAQVVPMPPAKSNQAEKTIPPAARDAGSPSSGYGLPPQVEFRPSGVPSTLPPVLPPTTPSIPDDLRR